MAAYRLDLRIVDLEVPEPPPLPLWDDADLTALLGSFHEWMRFALTDEQRRAARWTLTPIE